MKDGAELYQKYIDGDDSQMETMIRLYRDGLVGYITSFGVDRFTAQELAEDTFFKLAVKKPRFHARSSFKTWLYSIAHNVAVDHFRREARRHTVPIDECLDLAAPEPSPETAQIKRDSYRALRRSMAKLKKEYRQVLYLIYFEELSSAEIAVIMKKSSRSIDTLAWRARNALKAELMKEGFVYEGL